MWTGGRLLRSILRRTRQRPNERLDSSLTDHGVLEFRLARLADEGRWLMGRLLLGDWVDFSGSLPRRPSLRLFAGSCRG